MQKRKYSDSSTTKSSQISNSSKEPEIAEFKFFVPVNTWLDCVNESTEHLSQLLEVDKKSEGKNDGICFAVVFWLIRLGEACTFLRMDKNESVIIEENAENKQTICKLSQEEIILFARADSFRELRNQIIHRADCSNINSFKELLFQNIQDIGVLITPVVTEVKKIDANSKRNIILAKKCAIMWEEDTTKDVIKKLVNDFRIINGIIVNLRLTAEEPTIAGATMLFLQRLYDLKLLSVTCKLVRF